MVVNLLLSSAVGVGTGIATGRLDTGFAVGTGSLAVLAVLWRFFFSEGLSCEHDD